jgi:hypothetical protein
MPFHKERECHSPKDREVSIMVGWNESGGGKGAGGEQHGERLLLVGGGLLIVPLLLIVLLVSIALAPASFFAFAAGDDAGGGTTICPLSTAAATAPPIHGAGTPISSTSTSCIDPSGNAVVSVALDMAAHLHGDPDVWYDSGFPQAVITYWEQTCSGCPQWRNGNLQCVMFALAAYGVAGIRPPAAGNAIAFWSLYAGRPGWVEIPSGWASPGQRSLPQPGDWMVWYSSLDPTVGHIAVVVQVRPPNSGQSGSVTFAEANGPGPLVTEALLTDLTVATWGNYTVVGYIRHV